KDEYGGSLEIRARFLLNVIEAIRNAVGRDFHLQVKLSAVDHNNVVPWEKRGNTLEDTVAIAKWAEAAGADAIHVSQRRGSSARRSTSRSSAPADSRRPRSSATPSIRGRSTASRLPARWSPTTTSCSSGPLGPT